RWPAASLLFPTFAFAFPVSPPLICSNRVSSLCSPASLRYRPADSLGDIARQRFPQPVMESLLKHNRITRDLHHVTVEYWVVLAQKIRLPSPVPPYRDHACIRLHDPLECNLVDCQAALA